MIKDNGINIEENKVKSIFNIIQKLQFIYK